MLKEELATLIGDWKIPSWKIRCINAGFDGSTSRDLLNLLEDGVLIYKPSMVLCMIGDNDVHLGVSVEEYKRNIRELINRIGSSGVKDFIILTPPPVLNDKINERFMPYMDEIKKLFPSDKAVLIDLYKDFENIDLGPLYTFISTGNDVVGIKPGEIDFLHPNQLGNAYIAKFILKRLFDIEFDPEKYIQSTLRGDMYPEY